MKKALVLVLLLALFALAFSAVTERREDAVVDSRDQNENEEEAQLENENDQEDEVDAEDEDEALDAESDAEEEGEREFESGEEEEEESERESESESESETESESESESEESESEEGAEQAIEAQANLAVEAEAEAETDAEAEIGTTVVAAVSAMTDAEMESLSSAVDKMDENMEWVYARVRRAARKCPNRNVFKRFKKADHKKHHHHLAHHHHHAPKYAVPEFYEATCANVHRHLAYIHHITNWMRTSVYRMMTPAIVDPLYHSTFGKCKHFDNRKMRRRCRRIRMLRKALSSSSSHVHVDVHQHHDAVADKHSRHFVSPLVAMSAMHSGEGTSRYDAAPRSSSGKMSREERRRRLRHLRRSIRKLGKGVPKVGRALAALQSDVNRLSARLNGVTLPAVQPKIPGNSIANAKAHTDLTVGSSAATQTPQAQTASNLAHMNTVLNKLRSRLPKLQRKLGMMLYDVSKVSRSLARRRSRHHNRH